MIIEVWFEFASTYSYLTASRVEDVVRRSGLEMQWRPFLLGPIFRDKGWETSPFVLDPVKGAYMWRDMERRALQVGLPFKKPEKWPMNPILAARVATAAVNEPWCGAFVRGVFEAQYVHGQDISDARVIGTVLSDCGLEPVFWLARANDETIKSELRIRTDEARGHNIFGAPSFIVGHELFWGDDRLEDAVAWASEKADFTGHVC